MLTAPSQMCFGIDGYTSAYKFLVICEQFKHSFHARGVRHLTGNESTLA